MLIKQNGVYGGKVGNKMVFTREGAINIYKLFLSECYRKFDMGASMVLSKVEDDMVRLGFTYDELEEMELAELAKA